MIKLLDILKPLLEGIDPSDVNTTDKAIGSVIGKKPTRNLGTFVVHGNTKGWSEKEFLDKMKEYGLETLQVPENPHILYIFYRPGFKKEAEELSKIAEKYGGYFAWYAEDEDTRRIGELLGYQKDKVEAFVQKNSERAAEKRKEIAASKSKK